jgi:hypothetical protein
VNDSYIIVKHLVHVLYDEPFNGEWEQKITFGLQLAMEVESFDNRRDWGALLRTTRFPSCLAYCCCCFLPLPKMARGIRKNRAKKDGKYGPLRPAVGYCRDLKLAIGTSRFLGGESPGAADVSFYGTLRPFGAIGCPSIPAMVNGSGLGEWWEGMEHLMPGKNAVLGGRKTGRPRKPG